MIGHVVEFNAPAQVLETTGMEGFRDRVIPVLENQPGFEGYLILMSREQERLLGITLWDSEEHGREAGIRLEKERKAGVGEMGAESPIPATYEVLARR